MSGILNEAVTPCPSRARSLRFGDRNSGSDTFDSLLGDDPAFEQTGEIEFTTEVRAPILTGTRPRRACRAGSAFQIHEETEKPTGPAEKRRRPNGLTQQPPNRKSSLLAQPAQRFRPKVNFAPSPPSRVARQEPETQPKSKRVGPKSNQENLPPVRLNNQGSEKKGRVNDLKRDVRRDTVYIPPDDTTVASVFMGLFSPMKKQPQSAASQIPEETTQINILEAQIAKRQARKSLAVSARRAPLQPSQKIAQETALRVDVAGKNSGKENIPPGTLVEVKDKIPVDSARPVMPSRTSIAPERKPARRNTSRPSASPKFEQSSAKKMNRAQEKRSVLSERQNNVKIPTYSVGQEKDAAAMPKKPKEKASSVNGRTAVRAGLSASRSSSSMRSVPSNPKLKKLNQEYPLLKENISRPSLYDDDWLSHQEVVITQLVNALFECTATSINAVDADTLRLELLEFYHTDHFTHLYKRIQASLSCGALSIPRDILTQYTRLKKDVGIRRKFLDLWIQTYDIHALVAAAETVVGRRVSNERISFGSVAENAQENTTGRKKAMVRKAEGFLDTFLLRNDDMVQSTEKRDTPAEASAKAYRRTMLRCIMLVALLDKTRQSPASAVPRQLFVASSPFKSSADILQALARLLLPSCGDIIKPLGHLDCHLTYKQHQLQEYSYQIDNIAIDFRDGVRLTRIVEVLFFLSNSGDQTEISLCTGDVLSLIGEDADLPLSKHLKVSCASRAAKIFNVQIALGALSSLKGSNAIIGDIRAEDIVDGYREKTIALLWALVSRWGLEGLMNLDDMSKEIERLKRKAISELGYAQIKDEHWFYGGGMDGGEHAQLLQQWASILAALKGLQIDNMTTSFADGRVYASIVDEYEPFIAGQKASCCSLEARLEHLGCSSQFAFLVSPTLASSRILDADSTLAALAFLCSRLLAASRRSRAATTLQRAWRAVSKERDAHRRAVAKSLATQCAAVVQTRDKILWAKEVIVEWWRKTKARKQQRRARYSQSARRFNR
ncbi:hypothetical protein N7474_009058 [Penicillium riverlandense]|uniref:uncharacterized protein n=1 Tax=Penicillium riverlandense TaxID=1903569 RepID=UPI00254882B9|nr:uncharacterized protein N7474_009058 [Penicillium riverlandense]KAJ5807789.1 hypothetical protein N7474_009058 [Penicillium riverlandense]